jgi:hypothetical protein
LNRENDLKLLDELLNDHLGEMTDVEVEAFADMRLTLKLYGTTDQSRFRELTEKQREWVTRVHARIVPQYANLVSRGLVPRGREVPTPPALQNLPKRPPMKKREE